MARTRAPCQKPILSLMSSSIATIADAIVRAAHIRPEAGFTFYGDEAFARAGVPGEASFISFAELERQTAAWGGALQSFGLAAGDRVALIVPDNEQFVLCFLGAIRAGLVPVPMYPPLGLGQLTEYLKGASHVVHASGAKLVVTRADIKSLLGTLRTLAPEVRAIATTAELIERKGALKAAPRQGSDICFLQYTSGSTSAPKGVTLTHDNLLANAHCIMREGLATTAEDKGVSWLPLFHDMGLIGFVLSPIVHTVPVAFMPALSFLKRPVSWLRAISHERGTISFAPNFAYALSTKRIKERDIEGLDLSAWRIAGCGAEPIRAETLNTFASKFAPIGFDANAFLPAYGLAESCLAVTFRRPGTGMRAVSVSAEELHKNNRAQLVAEGTPGAVTLVSSGAGFPLHAVSAYSEADVRSASPLPDGHVGELRLRGPSITSGYFADAEKTRDAFAGDALRTGDLGFFYDGELYVSGRIKELLIINGRNYYPQDIEWAVSQLEGVRKGNVIAFGAEQSDGSTRVVVAFETELANRPHDREELKNHFLAGVRAAVQGAVGLGVDDVVPCPPGTLPKTSSGKLQRTKARALYTDGVLGHGKGKREGQKFELALTYLKSQLAHLRAKMRS